MLDSRLRGNDGVVGWDDIRAKRATWQNQKQLLHRAQKKVVCHSADMPEEYASCGCVHVAHGGLESKH